MAGLRAPRKGRYRRLGLRHLAPGFPYFEPFALPRSRKDAKYRDSGPGRRVEPALNRNAGISLLSDALLNEGIENIYINTYILYGRAYDKLGKPDSSTWVFKKGLKKFPDSEELLDWAAYSSSKEIRNGNTKRGASPTL